MTDLSKRIERAILTASVDRYSRSDQKRDESGKWTNEDAVNATEKAHSHSSKLPGFYEIGSREAMTAAKEGNHAKSAQHHLEAASDHGDAARSCDRNNKIHGSDHYDTEFHKEGARLHRHAAEIHSSLSGMKSE